LLSKGTGLTREKIRKLINKNQLNSLISRILEELREKEVRNEEKEENRENLLEENDFNVDDFINSQSEIQRFGEFEELG
jgi:signal recognition particle GTPase